MATGPITFEFSRGLQWLGWNIEQLWDTFGAVDIYGPTPDKNPDWLIVTTPDGPKRADIGDLIIQDARGALTVRVKAAPKEA